MKTNNLDQLYSFNLWIMFVLFLINPFTEQSHRMSVSLRQLLLSLSLLDQENLRSSCGFLTYYCHSFIIMYSSSDKSQTLLLIGPFPVIRLR